MKNSNFHFLCCVFVMMLNVTVMFGFGRNTMVTMWPEVLERFSISYDDIGMLTAVHQGAYFLASLVAGRLATTMAPELIISLSTIFGGVIIVSIGFIDQSAFLFASYGTLGALIALSWVPMVRYAATRFDKRQRVTALSTAACGTAIGFLVNGFLVPVALESFGIFFLWVLVGSLTVLVGSVSLIILVSFRAESVLNERRITITRLPENADLPDFPTNLFCALMFFCGVGLVSFQTYFAAYLSKDLLFTDASAARAWILPGALGSASGLMLAFVANRYSIKTTVQLCLFVLGNAMLALGLGWGSGFAAIAGIAYGVFYFGLFGLLPAYLTVVVSDQAASRIFGRSNLFLGIGSVCGGVLGGKIAHIFDSFEPFWFITAGSVAVAFCIFAQLPSDKVHSGT
ncbi:hypothetical protein ROLI_046970 (plasmid) [Roseobacter fucihabitans]|uniref:Major facilitator superfamily (MFS) profile domain-containing protein n=1 Tax=Roseobacter fucihabitans TaxID=1537242 RepID=A0ABZ2C2N6_9RHOB|nr:MFS transporter [Roseobacter litoralis]MBC6965967.1 Major Facilitator Superfamily protein [Roseobacter litoralis]